MQHENKWVAEGVEKGYWFDTPVLHEYVNRRNNGDYESFYQRVARLYPKRNTKDSDQFDRYLQSIMHWCLAQIDEDQVSLVSVLLMLKSHVRRPILHVMKNLHHLYQCQMKSKDGVPFVKIKPLSLYRTFKGGFFPVTSELIGLFRDQTIKTKVVNTLEERFTFYSPEVHAVCTKVGMDTYRFPISHTDFQVIAEVIEDDVVFSKLYHDYHYLPLVSPELQQCVVINLLLDTAVVYAKGGVVQVYDNLELSDGEVLKHAFRQFYTEMMSIKNFIGNGYRGMDEFINTNLNWVVIEEEL